MDKETRLCFFCEKAMAKGESNYLKKLRKSDSDADNSKPNESIKIVDVPRCPRCKSIHAFGFIASILAALSIGSLWYWYLIYDNISILNWIDSQYDPEVCRETGACSPLFFQFWGLFIGFALGNFIVNNVMRITTKPVDDAENYTLVVLAKNIGYQ